MRRLLFAALFASLWTTAASAAVVPVSGTLSFVIGPVGPISVYGSGMASTSGGVGSAASIPAGLFAGAATLSVPVTPPIVQIALATVQGPYQNLAGSFSPNGTMGNDLVANLFFSIGGSAGMIPLNYAGGGGTGMGTIAGLPVTFLGVPWTNLGLSAGNPTVTTMIVHSPAASQLTVTATAFDRRTAGGAGTLQLVAPASFAIASGVLGTFPVIGILTIHFVPEPGTLLLVGAGAVGLVAVARRRRAS